MTTYQPPLGSEPVRYPQPTPAPPDPQPEPAPRGPRGRHQDDDAA